MAFTLELEEWVGSTWHRFITRRASADFPTARVDLVDRQRSLAVLFRALGGARAVALEAASERDLLLRRNLLMRIAGTCKQASLASCDGNRLRLPASLAVFPSAALNLELYRWLALLAAHAGPMSHWARDNQRWTWLLLQRYPAMLPSYQRLVSAHIALRPEPASLKPAEAALENALRKALREPGSVRRLPRSERAAWPLPLWLYPALHLDTPQAMDTDEEGDDLATCPGEQQGAPKRANRVDEHSRDGGLLVVRLENLFSWSEQVDLDRWCDDSDDPDAARVAEDLDQLSLSRQRVRKSGGLKLHLDLPPADVDDIPLGEGI
jgi:nitric oxide reductase NorD protein